MLQNGAKGANSKLVAPSNEKNCQFILDAGSRTNFRTTFHTLKVRLGISRTNADSQWNLVYNVFHRIFCCGNETIRWQFCKRDLDAANLRPALEQGFEKQTPSARKLFFQANLLYVPDVKIQKGHRPRSVHFLGMCEKRTAAQCQIPIFPAGETRYFSEVGDFHMT